MDILLRFVFYMIRKSVLIFLIVLLTGITFFSARDVANVYVVVNEGLEARAEAILDQNVETEFLNRFFTHEFLFEDSLLNNNKYANFEIYSYRHLLRKTLYWIWPWSNNVIITVEERVMDILGEPKDTSIGLVQPPEWDNGRRKISLVRNQGRWQIYNIVDLETSLDRELTD